MSKERKEIKVRLHHIDTGFCREVWEVFAEEGKSKIYIGRETGMGSHEWMTLCDAPYGYCEPDCKVGGFVDIIVCDKQWNEVLRDGNDKERYPESFKTLEEVNAKESAMVRAEYPNITREGFGKWITDKAPADLDNTDRLNWRDHRSEVTDTVILRRFTWVGEKYVAVRVTQKHTMCDAIWYEYYTCRENREQYESYTDFIGYEYGDQLSESLNNKLKL